MNLEKIAEHVKVFHDRCEEQRREIMARTEAQEKRAQEQKERTERTVKKFENTILHDLQAFFKEVAPLFSSPYLDIVLDTHLKRTQFVISDNDSIPAYAFLALAARPGEDADDTFTNARYLLFAVDTVEHSLDLLLKNDERVSLCKGGNEEDSSIMLKSYPLDNYNLDEIKAFINKYLLEELAYHQENFRVEVGSLRLEQ
ncbi:hypothetical protein [Sphingobacterium haloxyli]|uniref:Uncharacterized protein n=1 Tax=Sphingobacterium haloxyli TaxID=2100533 RepID=A0A2S9J2C4_9SPHI|nr:hypothetical protein [Sphingobacterium haloxyli]PRD46909.1 hypothetical protein C5745_12475 [Sphingobacterium haloxyli]